VTSLYAEGGWRKNRKQIVGLESSGECGENGYMMER